MKRLIKFFLRELIIVSLFFFLIPHPVSASSQGIKIGWATTDITPVGTVLNWGWNENVSNNGNIHDKLHATAMAIQSVSGDMCSMIISCDLGSVAFGLENDLKAQLGNLLNGFDMACLFLIATHTHDAPFIFDAASTPEGFTKGSEYRAFLLGKLKAVAREAWNNRVAGAVSSTSGTAEVGWSRIWVDTYGKHLFCKPGDHPLSHNDHKVNLIYTYDIEGNITGVVINIACPAQEANGYPLTSADYWGEVRTQLQAAYPGIQVLPMLAFAGEEGPWNYGNGEGGGWDWLKTHATRIADLVKSKFSAAENSRMSSVELKHIVTNQAVSQKPVYGGSFNYNLHTVRIGEAVIVNNPCEVFMDYGYEIRSQSKAGLTFLAQLSSGDSCTVDYYATSTRYWLGKYPGYVPSAAAENENGVYSETHNEGPVSAAGGNQFVDQAVAQINKMFIDENK